MIFKSQRRQHLLVLLLFTQLVLLSVNAQDYQPLYASKAQSIVRRDSISQVLNLKIIDSYTFEDFAVFGYFKISSSATLSIEMAMMQFLSQDPMEIPFIISTVNEGGNYKVKVRTLLSDEMHEDSIAISSPINQWVLLGAGILSSQGKTLFVYQQGGQYINQQYSYQASPILWNKKQFIQFPSQSISALTLCLACDTMIQTFAKFQGTISSVKLLNGVSNLSSSWQILYANQATMMDSLLQSSYLSNVNLVSFVKSSDSSYSNVNTYECKSQYAYLDGVCVPAKQCSDSSTKLIIEDQYDATLNSIGTEGNLNCITCPENCSNCSSATTCTSCQTGYVLNPTSKKCEQCPQNSFFQASTSYCIFICDPATKLFTDLSNRICSTSTQNSQFHITGPLLNYLSFSSSDGLVTFNQISSQIQPVSLTGCFLNLNTQKPHSFLGGLTFSKDNIIKGSFGPFPNSPVKYVSFMVLVISPGTLSDIFLYLDSQVIPLTSSTQLFTNQQFCTEDISKSVNIYKVEYKITDSSLTFNLSVHSNVQGWGIRSLAVKSIKCHYSCKECHTDGSPSNCINCASGGTLINSQCYCQSNYDFQSLGYYSSPSGTCTACPVNCKKCNGTYCLACQTNYYLFNGNCVNSCPYQISDQGICPIQKQFLDIVGSNQLELWQFNPQISSMKYFSCGADKNMGPFQNGDTAILKLNLPTYLSQYSGIIISFLSHSFYTVNSGQGQVTLYSSGIQLSSSTENPSSSDTCENQSTISITDSNLVYPNSLLDFEIKFTSLSQDIFFTISQLSITYLRCKISCLKCNNLQVCSQCLDDSTLSGSDNTICTCNSGYYLQYDSSTDVGSCAQCNKLCLTCTGPYSTDCSQCAAGYKMSDNSICVSSCLASQYWDNTSSLCVDCDPCCSTCYGPSSSQCLSCPSTLHFSTPSSCSFDADLSTCSSCAVSSNSFCGGTQINHNLCLDLGWRLSGLVCVNCSKAESTTCGGSNVSVCNSYGFSYQPSLLKCESCDRFKSGGCGTVASIQTSCLNQSWMRVKLTDECMLCSSNLTLRDSRCCSIQCKTCSQMGPDYCLSCTSPLVLQDNSCLTQCSPGYCLDSSSNSCTKSGSCYTCHATCKICINIATDPSERSCNECDPTRTLVDYTCVCKDPEDKRMTNQKCSYNDIAVVDVLIDNLSLAMTLSFGKNLNALTGFPSGTNSYTLCQSIIDPSILSKLVDSVSSKCTFSGSTIIILLSPTSTVVAGDVILLKPNVLSFQTSPQVLIQYFYGNKVIQKFPLDTSLTFNAPPTANPCADYAITYTGNTGKVPFRGFVSAKWRIDYYSSSDPIHVNVKAILDLASSNAQTFILIPKGTCPLGKTLDIIFEYSLRNSFGGWISFTVGFTDEYLLQQASQVFVSQPFYNSYPYTISLMSYIGKSDSKCSPGIFSTQPIPTIDIKVTVTSVTYLPSSTSRMLDQVVFSSDSNSYNSINYDLTIPPFSLLTPGQNYNINIAISDSSSPGTAISSTYLMNPTYSPLIIEFKGHYIVANYLEATTITATARDPNLSSETDDQLIEYQWQCSDNNNPTGSCLDASGNEIVLTQTSNSQMFPAGKFNVDTTITLTLIGRKYPSVVADSATVIFQAIALPRLQGMVRVIDPFSQYVRLDEQIQINLFYESTAIKNIDYQTYKCSVIYNSLTIASMTFQASEFKFKLWDIYSIFDKTVPSIQFKIEVDNSIYTGASIDQMKFNIFFPPQSCVFSVIPSGSSNTALTTSFILSMDSCTENAEKSIYSLYYDFYYYDKISDQQEEIISPNIVNRKPLSEKQTSNQIVTTLPSGNLILMGIAYYNKNAAVNITKSQLVNSPTLTSSALADLITTKISESLPAQEKTQSLALLAAEIKKQPFSSELNDSKLNLLKALQDSKNYLPTISSDRATADQGITDLLHSTIVIPKTNLDNLITSFKSELDIPVTQSSTSDTFETFKKDQHMTSLSNSLKIMDMLGSKQEAIYQSEATADLLVSTLELIAFKINQYQLINQVPFSFSGKDIDLVIQKVSDKQLCDYVSCNGSSGFSNETPSELTQIYDFAKLTYQRNPYIQEPTFLDYTTNLQKELQTTTLSSYPVIVSIISHPDKSEISAKMPILLTFPKQPQTNTTALSCFSKNPKKKQWSQKGCTLQFSKSSQQYSCLCESPSAATILEDLDQLIFQNKNLQDAFSGQGILNIVNWTNFYCFLVFWILLITTITMVVLCYYGKKLDQASKNKFGKQHLQLKLTQNQQLQDNQAKASNKLDIETEVGNKNTLVCEQQQQTEEEDEPQAQRIPQAQQYILFTGSPFIQEFHCESYQNADSNLIISKHNEDDSKNSKGETYTPRELLHNKIDYFTPADTSKVDESPKVLTFPSESKQDTECQGFSNNHEVVKHLGLKDNNGRELNPLKKMSYFSQKSQKSSEQLDEEKEQIKQIEKSNQKIVFLQQNQREILNTEDTHFIEVEEPTLKQINERKVNIPELNTMTSILEKGKAENNQNIQLLAKQQGNQIGMEIKPSEQQSKSENGCEIQMVKKKCEKIDKIEGVSCDIHENGNSQNDNNIIQNDQAQNQRKEDDLQTIIKGNVKGNQKNGNQYQLPLMRAGTLINKTNKKKEQQIREFKKTVTLKKDHFNRLKEMPFWKSIMLFHNFFNIFLVFNPDSTRAKRFALFYLRTIHSLAISVVFNEINTVIQVIALAVINSVILILATVILDIVRGFSKIGKVIYSITLILLIVFYYYLILSTVSSQTPSESNTQIGKFFLLFFSDMLVSSVILAVVFRFLALYFLSREGQVACAQRLVDILQLNFIMIVLIG